MILRQFCARQSRQLFALPRQQPRMLNRFYSIETPVDTAVQTPASEPQSQPKVAVERGIPEEDLTPQDAWKLRQRQKKQFRQLGSTVTNTYDPEALIKNPPNANQITLEYLLASQTHLGHSTSRWNPQNSRYIFGIRDGIHIISLDVTAAHLRRAAKVVEEVAARGGLILFVGTREGQKRPVTRAAGLVRGYHIFERWIPGSLSNGQQILGHCETKVVNALDQEIEAFKPLLQDRAALKPDLVICLNPVENEVMLHECGLHNVPTIGVIDTDADPTRVTYPIPSNDDSLRAVSVIAGVLGRAGQDGQTRRLEKARAGELTYDPVDPRDLGADSKKLAELQQQKEATDAQKEATQLLEGVAWPQQGTAELQQETAQPQQETAGRQQETEPQQKAAEPQKEGAEGASPQ